MKYDNFLHSVPKLLVIIVDRNSTNELEDLMREKHAHLHYMFNAIGTASSEILKSLGLSGTEKTVCICMKPEMEALPLMMSVSDSLSLTRSGKGIAFIIPISGVSAVISNIFNKESEHLKERLSNYMDTGLEDIKDGANLSLVVSAINQGFSEILMDAARSVGAKGGTIVHARRSGIEDAIKFFGVTLQAEKEIVAILVPHNQKKELMQAITKKCGINTEAHGIVFSIPVESCSGISIENE